MKKKELKKVIISSCLDAIESCVEKMARRIASSKPGRKPRGWTLEAELQNIKEFGEIQKLLPVLRKELALENK